MLSSFKEVTIIIVLYQEKIELLRNCLNNLKNFKIIIIDNDNNLKLKNIINAEYKISKYILNKKNLGISKAVNMGIKIADTDYILNINPDCIITSEEIEKLLIKNKKYKNCFITSPTFFENENKLANNSAVFSDKKMNPKFYNKSYDGDVCVDWVLLSAILFKKKTMQDIGMLDENFFLYFLDEDICKRARRLRKSVIQVLNAKAIHADGISKVRNNLKKIFIRNFNFTYDELYYFYKINKHEKKLNIIKKKVNKYIFKLILNSILFRIEKVAYYLSLILAYKKFKKLI